MNFNENDRGNLLIITAILLPVLLLFLVLLADLGFIQLVRSQAQMAVDASSLAAVAVTKDEINITGVQVNNGSIKYNFNVEIDDKLARERAREVAIENVKRINNITWDEDDFVFKKTGDQSYLVEVTLKAKSVLIAPLFLDLGQDAVTLTVDSIGEVDLELIKLLGG